MRSTGSWLVYFGKELRLYRERAGLTQTELADRLGWGNGLISKIERAERVPQPDFCAALDTFFDADGHFTRLGEPVRQHSATARSFVDYLAREGNASALYTYEAYLVPGLLQTEAYARAVIEAYRPTVPPEQVQARLAARLTRQDVLERDDPPQFWAILGEAVLHCQVGSARVMDEQLSHLLAMAKRPHVTIQVVPFSAGVGPAMGQSFLVAEFPDSSPAFHVDVLDVDLDGSGTVEAVATYKLRFDHLRALALPDDASAAMIAARVEGLRDDG
jgi:transcriptional regulator with XRE-family HTH domain